MTPAGGTPVMGPGAPGYPHPPIDPVKESLKLAAECIHEQQETIEQLVRCLCHKCECRDRDDDEGDRDRRRRRHGDRDDDR